MGLFDFLKPKKRPLADLLRNSELGQGMELEYLQKQISNMNAVGRKDEARKLLAEFITKFEKSRSGPKETRNGLAGVSYVLAYKVLPDLVHRRWNEFLSLWKDGIPMSIYLALHGAIEYRRSLTSEQIFEFKTQTGRFSESVDYYLVSYPCPPAQEARSDTYELPSTPWEQRIWLGPHFSAALHNRKTGEKHLYILGQAPTEGTTLRCVTANGANCNCGPGPEPSIGSFLGRLKEVIEERNE